MKDDKFLEVASEFLNQEETSDHTESNLAEEDVRFINAMQRTKHKRVKKRKDLLDHFKKLESHTSNLIDTAKTIDTERNIYNLQTLMKAALDDIQERGLSKADDSMKLASDEVIRAFLAAEDEDEDK